MLTEVFKTVLWMSAAGSVLAVLIIILKPITERLFGCQWQYYIWLNFLILMTVPLKIFIKSDVASSAEKLSRFDSVKIIAESTEKIISSPISVAGTSFNFLQLCAAVWAIVAFAVFLNMVIRYMLFRRIVTKNSVAAQLEPENPHFMDVRISDTLKTPVMIGIFKPVLFIPESIKDQEIIKFILLHENVHYSRHDLVYKWLAALVSCVHWFNPFAHIAKRQMDRACELSCDSWVVRKMEVSEKKDYMRSILYVFQSSVRQQVPLSVGMADKKSLLRKRFKLIEGQRKTAKGLVAFGIILAFVMQSLVIFAVNAVRSVDISPDMAELVTLPQPFVGEGKTVQIVEPPKDEKAIFLPYIKEENGVNDPIPVVTEIKEEAEADIITFDAAEEKFEDIENKLKRAGKEYLKGDFSYQDGDTRIITGVIPDENGCISVAITSNTSEVIDIYFRDLQTGKVVSGSSFPVNKEGMCEFFGFEQSKKYEVTLKGTLRNNWEIESEFIIY